MFPSRLLRAKIRNSCLRLVCTEQRPLGVSMMMLLNLALCRLVRLVRFFGGGEPSHCAAPLLSSSSEAGVVSIAGGCWAEIAAAEERLAEYRVALAGVAMPWLAEAATFAS